MDIDWKAFSFSDRQHQAATALYALAREGSSGSHELPESLTLDEGLGAQLATLSRWCADGDTLGGWKIGLTSGAGRGQMGAEFRPFGYVLSSRILQSGFTVPLAGIGADGLEVEVAIEVGSSLHGPAVSDAEIREAIAGVRPAFELIQRRMPRPCDPGLQIADDLSQWGIAVGALQQWSGELSQLSVEVRRDGEVVAQVGPGFEIDGLYDAVRRICANLDKFGLGLEPGQKVITGALFKTDLDAPAMWSAEISSIGRISGTFC